jgi:hypothetical protein
MQFSFPGWGLSLRRSPEEPVADAVSCGVSQQVNQTSCTALGEPVTLDVYRPAATCALEIC